LLENASHRTGIHQYVCRGAILVMLADTMIPEAFEHGGKLAGVVNDTAVVLGFRAQIVFRHWMRRSAVAARTGLRIA